MKIKNMNSKMTTNSQVSTTEPKKTNKQTKKTKNKLSKHLKQEQNPRNWDHMEGYQWGEGGGNGAKSTGNKKHKWYIQSR